MRQVTRNILRTFAVLGVLSAFFLLLCLDTVDYEPYMRTAYYTETKSRLQSRVATNIIAYGSFSAGFGIARLTPIANAAEDNPAEGKFRALPLAGYGDRKGKPATGVHDDLFVKAVAMRVGEQSGIMFGIDALIVPREVADSASERLLKEFGLRREQLYFSATHTHCSLGGWGEGIVGELFAGKFDSGARAWFVEQIVSAARSALADLKPAEFGHGSFQSREFVRNRLVAEAGKVDPEFSYALIRQSAGRSLVLGSYSAHATVLSSDVIEFSGDYPGYWQRSVEEATGGIALFLAGGVGSHGPVPGEKGFKGAERMGRALGHTLVDHLSRTSVTNALAYGLVGVEVALPPFNLRVADGIRLRPWLSAQILQTDKPTFLQGFRIGSSVWLSTPCDFSGELALGIKDFLRVRGFQGIITSFNGDYIGYVLPSRYYHLKGYEPRVMSFYGPNVPDYLEELMRSLAAGLMSQQAESHPIHTQ